MTAPSSQLSQLSSMVSTVKTGFTIPYQVPYLPVLGIRDNLVRIRIQLRIRLLSSKTLKMQIYILQALISPLNTYERKEKDPDPDP
jgi:hypothetical protein